MTNDEQQIKPQDKSQDEPQHPASELTDLHPLATSIGAVGGGVAGAALGRSIIGGKVGAAIGGIAGAIAGGIAVNTTVELAEEVTDNLQPSGLGLGADTKPIELPRHYTWEELQALSKPQGGEIRAT
jgi:hypothetical protein